MKKEYRHIQIGIDEGTNREFESWSKRGWEIVNMSEPTKYTDSKGLFYYVLFSREGQQEN